jgi:predicted metalloprotease
MRGRQSFGLNEIHAIEHTLTQLERCDRRRRKALQGRLRRQYRFYASDFSGGARRLTAGDVEQLISQGVIRVH